MGYSFRLAPSHKQNNTYHVLCYTSRGTLDGTRNSSMGPPWRIDPRTHRTIGDRSYHGATSRSRADGYTRVYRRRVKRLAPKLRATGPPSSWWWQYRGLGRNPSWWLDGILQVSLHQIKSHWRTYLQKRYRSRISNHWVIHYTCMQCSTSHLQTFQENILSRIILATYRKFTVATVRFTQNVSWNIYTHPRYQQVANVTV